MQAESSSSNWHSKGTWWSSTALHMPQVLHKATEVPLTGHPGWANISQFQSWLDGLRPPNTSTRTADAPKIDIFGAGEHPRMLWHRHLYHNLTAMINKKYSSKHASLRLAAETAAFCSQLPQQSGVKTMEQARWYEAKLSFNSPEQEMMFHFISKDRSKELLFCFKK